MTTKIKPCSDCGADVKADTQDPRPICLECLDIFMARGGRSNPFWRDEDAFNSRMVALEMGDL